MKTTWLWVEQCVDPKGVIRLRCTACGSECYVQQDSTPGECGVCFPNTPPAPEPPRTGADVAREAIEWLRAAATPDAERLPGSLRGIGSAHARLVAELAALEAAPAPDPPRSPRPGKVG